MQNGHFSLSSNSSSLNFFLDIGKLCFTKDDYQWNLVEICVPNDKKIMFGGNFKEVAQRYFQEDGEVNKGMWRSNFIICGRYHTL